VRPRWSTVLWLALSGGRSDRTRIGLTAAGAALATLSLSAAATVAAIGPGDGPYTSDLLNQSGLHVGVVTALVLLCLPVLGFAGQCSRVGAPSRDRRLAAFRLQGATPADVVRIAAVETGWSAGLGVLLGLALYAAARFALSAPVTATYEAVTGVGNDRTYQVLTGQALRFPTDVTPPWAALVVVALAVPLLSAGFAALTLRRVVISPFGVTRRGVVRPPALGPALLFLGGTAGLAGFSGVVSWLGEPALRPSVLVLLLILVTLVTTAGLLLGTTAFAALVGRLVSVRTGRPAVLLAARRLVSAPSQTSRTNATLLLVVLLAAFTQGYRERILTETANYGTTFYADTLDLVNLAFVVGAVVAAAGLVVGSVDGILTRRQVLAGMSAVGVPRSTLARSVVAENLVALGPAVVLAAAAGILAARGVLGTRGSVSEYGQDGNSWQVVVDIGVPWAELGILVAGVLAMALLASLISLPLLRASVRPSELRAG
jgi:hypothetical protein